MNIEIDWSEVEWFWCEGCTMGFARLRVAKQFVCPYCRTPAEKCDGPNDVQFNLMAWCGKENEDADAENGTTDSDV